MTAAANIQISTPDEFPNLLASLGHDKSALLRCTTPLLGPGGLFRRLKFTTDDSTAAASSPVLNLSELGVEFAADTERYIILDVLASNGSNRYRFQTRTRVLGSATAPAVKGSPEFLTSCAARYGFTTADGSATTEDAAACLAPAWWDGAVPVAGDASSNAITIQWLGANSPVGLILPGSVQHFDAAGAAADARSIQHGSISLANGTSTVFVSDVASPTAANFSNASVVRIRADVFPPIECLVLANTSPNPDEIFIGAKGLSSDVVTWEVDVYVSDAKRLPLA